MGYNQDLATSYYQFGGAGSPVYHSFPVAQGMSTYAGSSNGYAPISAWSDFNYVMNSYTDSAPAATAMSTGVKTYDGAIGVDMQQQPLLHIADRLKEYGKSTGVVSTVQLSHATPAGFVAHNISRNNYAAIAREMFLDSRVDVIIGCGNPEWDDNGLPATKNPQYVGGASVWAGLVAGQTDFDTDGNGTIDNTVEDANGDGVPDPWILIQDRASFQALASGPAPARLAGLPQCYTTTQQARSGNGMADPYVVPLNQNVPTLAEMTQAAINVLDDNPNGLFLMVEGGAIDWACHANQKGRMIEEQIDFNGMVDAVCAWIETNSNWDESVVIVTGDHECGYLTGPGSGPGTPPVWNPVVNNGAGVVPGMEFHSGSHTNALIPFYCKGPGSDRYAFVADETDAVRGRFVNNTECASVLFEFFPPLDSFVPAPRNIIVMISDGCGYSHVDAASYWQYGGLGMQIYDSFPFKAPMSTWSASGNGYAHQTAWSNFTYVMNYATDPASSATAMSTGVKTYGAAIGVDLAQQPLTHVAQMAEEMEKSTGVITTVEWSHATPAGFVAHNISRNNYAEIAREMILDSKTDVIMGCGNPWFNDNGQPVQAPNDYKYVGGQATWDGLMNGQVDFDLDGNGTIDNSVEDAGSWGNYDGVKDPWHVIQTREEFQALMAGPVPQRVLGVAQAYTTTQQARGGDGLADPFVVPLNQNVPTLAEMSPGALNVLDGNPNGFFLMIEGGAVDWAGHANQSGRVIEEEIDFNRAVETVCAWVEANSNWDETLVIVTGDHETGYLLGPGSGPGTPPVFNPIVNNGAGVLPGMQWNSGNHTNSLIPFYAKGAAAALLPAVADAWDGARGRFLNNSEIAHLCMGLWPGRDGQAPSGVDPVEVATVVEGPRAFPNPVSGASVISFAVPRTDQVSLEVYDILGRRVATLFEGARDAGQYQATWDATGLPGGVYFARLSVGRDVSVRKLAVTR